MDKRQAELVSARDAGRKRKAGVTDAWLIWCFPHFKNLAAFHVTHSLPNVFDKSFAHVTDNSPFMSLINIPLTSLTTLLLFH